MIYKKKNYLIVLQARCSSKRLPGKVLKKINGIPLVILCARRLSNLGANILVATSKHKTDNNLVKLLIKEKINYFRGGLNNVFSRYLLIARKFNNKFQIIRATADNPLPDGSLVNTVVKHFNKIKSNYFGIDHKLHNLPQGMSLEIFNVKKIKEVSKQKLNKEEKEHVTLKMYKNKKIPNLFIKSLKIKKNLSNIKLSIDERHNLKKMREIFKNTDIPLTISWKKLLNHL
jgi:spore coat polysaccharide biosynthesis protein SpsF